MRHIECINRTKQDKKAIFIHEIDNIGISGGNWKLLLENVSGDFFVPVDADDFLSVDAIQMLAYHIEKPRRSDFLHRCI
jgi:hypothetical protein